MKFTIKSTKDDLEQNLSAIEEQLAPIITFLKLSNSYDWRIVSTEERRYGSNADIPITYEFESFEDFKNHYIGNHINTIDDFQTNTVVQDRYKEVMIEAELRISICESFLKY